MSGDVEYHLSMARDLIHTDTLQSIAHSLIVIAKNGTNPPPPPIVVSNTDSGDTEWNASPI